MKGERGSDTADGASVDPEAIASLVGLLKSPAHQAGAVRGLAAIGGPEALPGLVAGLRARSGSARGAAARALVQIGGPRVERALLAAFRRGDLYVTRHAYELCVRAAEQGREDTLVRALLVDIDQSDFPEMVRFYMRSGQPALVKGARQWLPYRERKAYDAARRKTEKRPDRLRGKR